MVFFTQRNCRPSALSNVLYRTDHPDRFAGRIKRHVAHPMDIPLTAVRLANAISAFVLAFPL